MSVVIVVEGRTKRIEIKKGPALGLDEKAAEAISQWTFRPALRNGVPVAAAATVEVNFRLL